MITFKTLQSGSIGNCYLIENQREILIIEAGLPLNKIIANTDVTKIVGALVSHSHSDHSKYLNELLKYNIPCFTPYTNNKEEIYKSKIGEFYITALPVKHDVKNYAFVIDNEEIGRVLYITDTNTFNYLVKNVDTLIIECNYTKELAEENILNDKLNINVFKRTLENHMSINKCIEIIVRHKPTNTILIHLSSRNISNSLIYNKIKDFVNYTNVYIAEENNLIDITKF
ncbi:MAG: MBL fold metallo-hydrolase [Candidatus Pacearchaeota archaeon]